MDTTVINHEISEAHGRLDALRQRIGEIVIGQTHLVERLCIALLCNQHLLVEGVPGLAKTLTITTLAQAVGASFSRIQFTPDLLPGDLVGTLIYNPGDGSFQTRKGPIFANIVLADEINRAPAKVQSALLEAMQERQVTIGDASHRLPDPFLVLATQNPLEQEGTYPLPEAQVDRFMFKVLVTYPSREEEKAILARLAKSAPPPAVEPVLAAGDIVAMRRLVDRVYVDERLHDYIVDVVAASRDPERYGLDLAGLIRYGASPRASIFLVLAARAHALLQGRDYATPEDVKAVAPDILRHRIIPTYEAEAEEKDGDDLAAAILAGVPIP